uniref:hypothetical protein n=1 Tax=Cupriavidus taiwanensis TaxID=164546 RepID=UPI0011C048F2|nr:hypothetical protein [Cupriavidus taiwanensis]
MSDISHVEGVAGGYGLKRGCGLSVNAGAINGMAGIRTHKTADGPVWNTAGFSALLPITQ